MACAWRPKSSCAGAINCNVRPATRLPKITLLNFTETPAVVLIVSKFRESVLDSSFKRVLNSFGDYRRSLPVIRCFGEISFLRGSQMSLPTGREAGVLRPQNKPPCQGSAPDLDSRGSGRGGLPATAFPGC